MKFRCYFHNLEIPHAIVQEINLTGLFEKLENETKIDKLVPKEENGLKILLIWSDNYVPSENGEKYVLGKIVRTEKDINFGQEKDGKLGELRLSDGTNLFSKERGVLFFILYINEERKKYVLMLEDIPFSIGVRTFLKYVNERLELDSDNQITSSQQPGRDFGTYLEGVGHSNILKAKIRLKKNITNEMLEKIGEVQEAIKSLRNKNYDAELILHWRSREGIQLTHF